MSTCKVDTSRIDRCAPDELLGREAELGLLSDAWLKMCRDESQRPHVINLVAVGGEGKTSLVAKWVAGLAADNWPGAEMAFAWSFHRPAIRDPTVASSDLFFKQALTFFGDPETADSAQAAFDKGKRLAELVGEQKALLILDALEPLQYPPTSPRPGQLRDPGLSALLKGLAASSRGLCVVTTRYSVTDLKAYWHSTAPETKLGRLSPQAGVALLRSLGVHGSQSETERLVEDVNGHALTLNLLGAYLHEAHAGDLRKRDLVKLEEADGEEHAGRVFRVVDAYMKWFQGEGDKGKRAIAVLRLLGYFDRPASADCLAALKQVPAIPDLTEALVGMSEVDWDFVLKWLADAKLLTVNRDATGKLLSLDTHPLLRDYFSLQLRNEHSDAWQAGHRRLFEHLCTITEEKDQPNLEDLQPLYQAVAHGCQGGLQLEACNRVYMDRIQRGTGSEGFYSTNKLGAFGADLEAVAGFFEQPWSRLAPSLAENCQAWLLGQAAVCLHALGRLGEAVEPMRAGLEMSVTQNDWESASVRAGNLSELELTLGEVAAAIKHAEQSVAYADRNGDPFQRMINRTILAYALCEAGRRIQAEARFREAEAMQAKFQPQYPLLYAVQGFRYCDLLLLAAERSAWARTLGLTSARRPTTLRDALGGRSQVKTALRSCRAVAERAARMFEWRVPGDSVLEMALDHLTLDRAALYASILDPRDGRRLTAAAHVTSAVDGLRDAGQQQFLPHGLLTRAWLRCTANLRTGPESAQADLDEAWETAKNGPMPLLLADIHLHRARLFHAVTPYPWTTDLDGGSRGPKDDLAVARRLIEKHSYWRRREELEDAEEAAKQW